MQLLPRNQKLPAYSFSLPPLSLHSPQHFLPNNPSKIKDFFDNFDNNRSNLTQNKSFAHNFKGRLLGIEQNSQVKAAKIDRDAIYREQLKKQIDQNKARKQRQNQKNSREEMERQRKFYEGVKRQQQMIQREKENANYNTNLNKKEQTKDSLIKNDKNLYINLNNVKSNARGKNYLNQSSLDSHQYVAKQTHRTIETEYKSQQSEWSDRYYYKRQKAAIFQQEIVRDKAYEQQRISSLLISQERMLSKIGKLKMSLKSTQTQDSSTTQVLKIRKSLKPINFNSQVYEWKSKDIGPGAHYLLPIRNDKTNKSSQNEDQSESEIENQQQFISYQNNQHEKKSNLVKDKILKRKSFKQNEKQREKQKEKQQKKQEEAENQKQNQKQSERQQQKGQQNSQKQEDKDQKEAVEQKRNSKGKRQRKRNWR